MATIVFGLVVLALLLWALNAFTKVNPQTAAVVLKTGGGLGALAVAGVLGVRGRLDIAIPLGLTGLGLLGWLPWSMPGLAARTNKSAGQVSRVRSAFVEMELDHDTGAMRGRILAGRHEGAMLDALDIATLTGFLTDVDEESRALLMAYLDRREPRWREHTQAGAAAGAPAVVATHMAVQVEAQPLESDPTANLQVQVRVDHHRIVARERQRTECLLVQELHGEERREHPAIALASS